MYGGLAGFGKGEAATLGDNGPTAVVGNTA